LWPSLFAGGIMDEIWHNRKYVFAMSSRYNWGELNGRREVGASSSRIGLPMTCHVCTQNEIVGKHGPPNNCVQATPDHALLFIVAQVSGAPDAERYATS